MNFQNYYPKQQNNHFTLVHNEKFKQAYGFWGFVKTESNCVVRLIEMYSEMMEKRVSMWIMFDTVLDIEGQPALVGKGQIEYEEVQRIKKLFKFVSSYSVVKMMEDVVIRNYQDYTNHMRPENLKQYHKQPEEAVIVSNKCALNYATSIQSFIDVTKRQLKVTKPTEKELELYRQFQSLMYDRHVEYRFWMRLRNFIVHCSFPYTKVYQNGEGIKVICSKSHLLSFDKWNAVRKDIEQMEDSVPIEQMLQTVTTCITALRMAFVGMYAEEIAFASREYYAFCKAHKVKEPVFVETESEEQAGINGFTFNPLPVGQLIEALEDLKKVPFVKLSMVQP